MSSSWLADAVSEFGERCKAKLSGPGEAEAAIRSPIEQLLAAAGSRLGLDVVPHDEVRDDDRGVRPDYAISVGGAITGYVEVKKPGASLDPEVMTGHNRRQWERQRDLPNLIYTNGTEWRLYRDCEPVGDPVHLGGGTLRTAGRNLTAPPELEQLLTNFLRWKPAPITSVIALVRAVAPLTRLLRGEVLDQLKVESRAIKGGDDRANQPFHGLARDWRKLLFPTATDDTFADGYAQTVTFALLLARTEGITLAGPGGLHEVGQKLRDEHSLMARALQLLTDYVAEDFKVTIDLMVRVIDAVEWPKVRAGKRDTYLHLYERFLDEYDPELRKQSGSYYTPREVVEEMVRLTEEVLVTRLGKTAGFADPDVVTADPAMGTGTYLHSILEHVATRVTDRDGPGAAAGAVTDLARRLYGFELQMGPFAVAELRTTDLMASRSAKLPPGGLGLFVTDTLDDPYAEQTQLGSGLELISQSRSRAAKVKSGTKVTVVIGNPPYRERAEGMGGWIENGSDSDKSPKGDHYRPLDDFRAPGNGRNEYVLKNLYIYFWRWATWKVFNADQALANGDVGVVCYITTSGYLRGPGFKGMREYLRRTTSEGWIIDVSPEGMRPDVSTRIFPGVQQPLAIAMFTRRADCDPSVPAPVHYTALHGTRVEKYADLAKLGLDDEHWRDARTDWQAPFTPAAESAWDDFPAVNDLLPWSSPGVKGNRTWIIAPAVDVLKRRWSGLRQASSENSPAYFKDSGGSRLDQPKSPLPGSDVEQDTAQPLASQFPPSPTIVRYGFRFLDRQWIIADHRVIDRARLHLWAARRDGQVFVIEQHAEAIDNGPGLVFSALIPDMHHFNNRGGRALPLLHPGGRANLAKGLLGVLSTLAGLPITADDVVAYMAGVTSHPGFTARFTDELTTPGVRVPITADPELFNLAVSLGKEVVWTHTYGAAFPDAAARRPSDNVRFSPDDERRVANLAAVDSMPSAMTYDPATQLLELGDGTFGPVPQEAWEYTIGGKNVLRSWFNYRKASPTGRKSSPLDDVNADSWPMEWTSELLDLLSVLARLVEVHPKQAVLLEQILAGPIVSRNMLAGTGVTWPGGDTDPQRKPDYLFKREDFESTDDGQMGFTFA